MYSNELKTDLDSRAKELLCLLCVIGTAKQKRKETKQNPGLFFSS